VDFEQRLQRAIQRGEASRDAKEREAAGRALSEEECKRLHSQYRLELSDHIERCLQRLPDHFPGFQFETIVGDRGWGAAVSRDDVGLGDGGRRNLYSRLEVTVRPYTALHVLEVAAKGTIRNREVFNRNQYQKLAEADPQVLRDSIDLWIFEYAERYTAER
jgi:hypothetical protein